MNEQERIREGVKGILREDWIVKHFTHENPPPGKDCSEECNVSLDDQIAAANPVCSPMRSGGRKHKKCMDCWNEYIEELITKILKKQDSEDVVIRGSSLGFSHPHLANYYTVKPLIEEEE